MRNQLQLGEDIAPKSLPTEVWRAWRPAVVDLAARALRDKGLGGASGTSNGTRGRYRSTSSDATPASPFPAKELPRRVR